VAALVVALICLASFRLTRLIARDAFPPLAVQRARVAARWGDHSWQAYLSECQWCVGVYVSGLVTLAAWLLVDLLPVPLLVWAAAAAVTGVLAVLVEALDKIADHHDLAAEKLRRELRV
jgi:hypothetical protein